MDCKKETETHVKFPLNFFLFSLIRVAGENQSDCGTLSYRAAHADLCIVQLCAMLYNGQSKTSTAKFFGMTLFHPIESLEDSIPMLIRNPDTSILHRKADALFGLLDPYYERTLFFVIFDCVVTEVKYHIIQNLSLTEYRFMVSGKLHVNVTLFCLRLQSG